MSGNQGQWQPGSQGTATQQSAELRSPFAGTPRGDAVRDVVAAGLLLWSLTLPWDHFHQASQRLEVVLVTAVSLASLAVGYLARANAFGPALTPARAGTARLLANVPYLVLFVAFLLVDAFSGANRETGGVGAAAAVGLAGALLAAQPREAELVGRARPHPLERAWIVGPVVVAALFALTVLVSLLIFLVGDDLYYVGGRDVAITTLSLLLGIVIIWLPLIGVSSRNASWRLVLIALAVAPIGLYLVGNEGAVPAPMVESIHTLSPGLIYWPALAVLVSAPAVRRAMRRPVAPWIWAATNLMTVAIVVAATDLLVAVLLLADSDQTARRAILVVLALFYVVVAVLARVLPMHSRGGRRAGFAIAAALLVLGCVSLAVTAGDPYQWVTPADLLLAVVIPVALAVFLAVQTSQEARGVVLWVPAAVPTGPPPAPQAADPLSLAADPATPPAVLADLAARVPESWVLLARNPATYPDLLTWLAALDRPEVTEALRERAEQAD